MSASRWSQIISTAVYLVFVALALPVVHTLNGKYDDNSLIALVGVAAALLAVPLIVAAALSQFSAAVADTLAATGNMQESTHGHLKAKWGCILVGGGAIALTWSASTLEIVALASRAFAFYYMLQCLVAISVSKSTVAALRHGDGRRRARLHHGLRGSRELIADARLHQEPGPARRAVHRLAVPAPIVGFASATQRVDQLRTAQPNHRDPVRVLEIAIHGDADARRS